MGIFGSDKNIFTNSRGGNLRTRKSVDVRVDKFDGGVNVLFSETRLRSNEAKEATNLILDEDGIWKKRWGTAEYGTSGLFTNILDGFSEYRKSDGTRELIVVADGKVWRVDPSAGTKTEITGATFTQGYACDFVQIESNLYIVNGQDDMALYGGSTLSTYGSISTPTWDGTPLTRGAGLSAGSYTMYYRVSAVNEVGETLAAAEESISVDQIRDDWGDADEYVDVGWADVAGAKKYIIYMSDVTGYEVKLDETTASTYRDTGSAAPNPYLEPPDASTAAGPKFKSIGIIGNRIWGTNDVDNPQRVYWTGTGANLSNFAPAFDGGWIDLETGSRNQTVKVMDFNKEAHVICKTDDGRGSIWEIDFVTVDIAGSTITVPQATKLIAQMGSNAPRSVVHVENDIYFLNIFGVFTLGYEPNVFNVLRTSEKSAQIRPYIRGLYAASLSKTCSYYYDSKVFFSVPTTSGEPNRTFLYDREKSAWIKDWTIGVSQFGEFTDSSGNTHFLGICGKSLIEFSENFESDSGTAFTWRYISPRIPVSKDWTQFAFISLAYVKTRAARGTPQFIFTGTTASGASPVLATGSIEQGSSDTGIGWDQLGVVQVGSTLGAPTLFAQESLIKYLVIDEVLRDIQWEISGDAVSDKATITGLMAEGRIMETDSPESWQL